MEGNELVGGEGEGAGGRKGFAGSGLLALLAMIAAVGNGFECILGLIGGLVSVGAVGGFTTELVTIGVDFCALNRSRAALNDKGAASGWVLENCCS